MIRPFMVALAACWLALNPVQVVASSDAAVGAIRVKTARFLGASSATAFAVARDNWATAAHAPDGCTRLWLDGNPRLDAFPATIDARSDLAVLLSTSTGNRQTVSVSRETAPMDAIMLGFPGGRAAAVKARRIGRVNLVYTGRQRLRQKAWVYYMPAAVGASLRGISGGPAIAGDGTVFGVIVAASARGRVYVLDIRRISGLLRSANRTQPPSEATSLPVDTNLRDYVAASILIRRLRCTR